MSVACTANEYVTWQYVHICWVYLKTLLLTCSYSVLKTLHINFYFIKWTAIFKYIHLIHFNPLRMKIILNNTKTFSLYHTVNTVCLCPLSQPGTDVTGKDEIPIGITETWLQTRWSTVQFPAVIFLFAKKCSHWLQINRCQVFFPTPPGKVARAWRWPLPSSSAIVNNKWCYSSISPAWLSGMHSDKFTLIWEKNTIV
jgi:hypothetical protein